MLNPKLFIWSHFLYYLLTQRVLEVKEVSCKIIVMCVKNCICGYGIQNGILENVTYISNTVENFIGIEWNTSRCVQLNRGNFSVVK